MKHFLIIALLSLTTLAVRGDDEEQDITVNPVVLDDGYMAVNQGAFWPALSGNWMVWLNSTTGSIQSFPFTLTGNALNLNSSVGALDLTIWSTVRDLTENPDYDGIYGGSFLGSSIAHLRLRIQVEGYSAGVLAEYQDVKSHISP